MRSTPGVTRHSRRPGRFVAVAALVVLASCGGSDSDDASPDATSDGRAAAALPAPGLVQPADVEALVASGVRVIDVRTPQEFAEGHLAGADLIDIYEPDFADRISELDPDDEYLVYCRSGNRSGQAVALMAEMGFDTVFDLDGGVLAYDAAGLPLER